MRKHEAIDLLQLYVQCNTAEWNSFLTKCLNKKDFKTLFDVYYGLQAGMVDLSKKKLNSAKMIEWFLRLQTSVEKTIKILYRKKHPNPCDNPLIALDNIEHLGEKRERDNELEVILRKARY